MPIYEFQCGKCGEPFEELVRSSEAVKDIACPACGSPKVKKKMSAFSAQVSGGTRSVGASAACAPGGT